MIKHCFYINPTAGHIDAAELAGKIEAYCRELGCDFKIMISETKGEITQVAEEDCGKYKEIRAYSVGGDGTIYEVLNGIMRSDNEDAVLVPVPCGSGNDFVRTFGYDIEEPFDDLLKRAIRAGVKSVDVIRVNDKYGLNIASVGFDAKVVMNAVRFKKIKIIPDRFSYKFSVFYTFVTQGAYQVKIITDGSVSEYDRILLTACANGQYYGGGMRPVPSAVIDDGELDVCIVEKVSKLKIPRFFPKYEKGEGDSVEQAHFVKCRKLEISSEKELPLNIDGEVFEYKNIVFEICDRRVNIGVLPLD